MNKQVLHILEKDYSYSTDMFVLISIVIVF